MKDKGDKEVDLEDSDGSFSENFPGKSKLHNDLFGVISKSMITRRMQTKLLRLQCHELDLTENLPI